MLLCRRTVKVVKRAAHVEIRNVDMPVLMRLQRLMKARSFLRSLAVPPPDQSRLFEHAIDAARAGRHHVLIHQHVGQPTIALQRMRVRKRNDSLFFIIQQPVITRNPGVVFVDFLVAFSPVIILASSKTQPSNQLPNRQSCFLRPIPNVFDNRIANIVRRPGAI